MPICTILLVSLSVPIPQFLSAISSSPITPLTIGRVVRWIILPTATSTDKLLAQNIHWDLLLTLPNDDALPVELRKLIRHQWIVHAGVPSRLLQDFAAKNKQLLHPKPSDVPKLTGSLTAPRTARRSSQSLELSPELTSWISKFGSQQEGGGGAVSMLNLLAFKPGKRGEYLKYGAEFAKTVGSKRGGRAKIVGTVVVRPDVDVDKVGDRERGEATNGARDDGEGWDEVAIAHYPTILHFADMLASEDYQAVNQRYRVGSLRDTFILCTTEIGLETAAAAVVQDEHQRSSAKL